MFWQLVSLPLWASLPSSLCLYPISQPSSIQSLFPLLLGISALFSLWHCDEKNQKRIHVLLSQCILISKCSKRLHSCIPITIVFFQRTMTPGPLPNSCHLFHVRRVCRSVILCFFKVSMESVHTGIKYSIRLVLISRWDSPEPSLT